MSEKSHFLCPASVLVKAEKSASVSPMLTKD